MTAGIGGRSRTAGAGRRWHSHGAGWTAYDVDLALLGYAAREGDFIASDRLRTVHAASRHEQQGEDDKVLWSEYGPNDVYRHFDLPKAVNAERVTAHLDNGILHVLAPKVEQREIPKVPVSNA